MRAAVVVPFSPPSQPRDIERLEDQVVAWVGLAGEAGLTSVEIANMDAEICGTASSVEYFAAMVARLVDAKRLAVSNAQRSGRRVVVSA